MTVGELIKAVLKDVTRNSVEWKGVLSCMAILQCDFVNALLIHAQMPNASCIKTKEEWEVDGKVLKSGSKAVKYLRYGCAAYGFDISDTISITGGNDVRQDVFNPLGTKEKDEILHILKTESIREQIGELQERFTLRFPVLDKDMPSRIIRESLEYLFVPNTNKKHGLGEIIYYSNPEITLETLLIIFGAAKKLGMNKKKEGERVNREGRDNIQGAGRIVLSEDTSERSKQEGESWEIRTDGSAVSDGDGLRPVCKAGVQWGTDWEVPEGGYRSEEVERETDGRVQAELSFADRGKSNSEREENSYGISHRAGNSAKTNLYDMINGAERMEFEDIVQIRKELPTQVLHQALRHGTGRETAYHIESFFLLCNLREERIERLKRKYYYYAYSHTERKDGFCGVTANPVKGLQVLWRENATEHEEWISWERAEAEISRMIQEKCYASTHFFMPDDFYTKQNQTGICAEQVGDKSDDISPEISVFPEQKRLLPAVMYDYSYLFAPAISIKEEMGKTDKQDKVRAQKAEKSRKGTDGISTTMLISLCKHQKVSYLKPSLRMKKTLMFGNIMVELKDYEECIKESLQRISSGGVEKLHIRKDMEFHYFSVSSRDEKAYPKDVDALKCLETAERMLNGKLDDSDNPTADLLKSIYHERMSDKKKTSVYRKRLTEIYNEVSRLPYQICNDKECYHIILDCIRQCITSNHARTVMVLPEYLIRYADTLIASISKELYGKTVIGIPDKKELADVSTRKEISLILITKEEFERIPLSKEVLISDIEHKIEKLSGYIAMEKRLMYGNSRPYQKMQDKLMERLEYYMEKKTETEQTWFEMLSADSIYFYSAGELLNQDIISRQYCRLSDIKSHETAVKISMSKKSILSFEKKVLSLQENFMLYKLLHPDVMEKYQLNNLDVWCSIWAETM